MRDQVYVLTDQAHQHRLHLRHDAVDVQNLGTHRLPAAEGEELTRERGRPLAGLANVPYLCAHGRVQLRLGQKQVAVAQDGGEDVVEVVRHAAGQTADGVDLLRLS